GTNYLEVYPLGTVVTVGESQQEAMRSARQNSSHLAEAGAYEDYYALFEDMDGGTVLIGMTYNLSELIQDIRSQTLRGSAFAAACQLVLSFICLGLVSFFVLRPLKKVERSIRLYKKTKDSSIVEQNLSSIRMKNEIGQLSTDVIGLSKEIDEYLGRIETITAEKERIGTELSLAMRIQTAMLPSVFPAFPSRPELDIYAVMDPAKEVGGDFYDFFFIDEDHLCLVIADVSGKGIPAALFMMAAKIILANYAKMGVDPAGILRETNRAICANNREEMFVTVWLGILTISTGKLTAANAGHEYPCIKKADGQFELLRDKHGFVIGGMEDVEYTDYELILKPGSKLFLYTDGVAEATDEEDQLFGEERILEALNEDPEVSPEQLLKNVRSAVDGFVKGAEQFDDITMLCVEYKGPKGTGRS
ncbi:MAG: PP2C family protein-serine/threonine phosphatase, partial [Stomatobaculum sp.]|nr:PP2C family protein-serine/threonine phosphatase [Stomatobaculum sp.]